MQNILQILRKTGGWRPSLYLKIPNPPYMELVIEAVDESGRCGLPSLSVAHYGLQNGDPMRDPEMCFELGLSGGAHLNNGLDGAGGQRYTRASPWRLSCIPGECPWIQLSLYWK